MIAVRDMPMRGARPTAGQAIADRLWASGPIGMLELDAHGVVRVASPALVRLLGEDPTGSRAELLILTPQRPALRRLLDGPPDHWHTALLSVRAGAGPTMHDCDVACRPDATGATVIVAPPDPEAATIYGKLVTVNQELVDARRDTMRRQATLEDTVRRLVALDGFKDEVLGVVSHDLRAPLTSIAGFAELLRDAGASATERDGYVDAIDRAAARMEHLIDDLLLGAQIQAGTLPVRLALEAPRRLVQAAIDAAAPSAVAAGLIVDADLADVPDGQYDAARIAQLLDNVLSNATKFTPAGGTVTVRLRGKGAGCTVEVGDDGIGIPGDELGHLFDRFFRASSATAHHISGTGLGLASVRAVARAHGGDATVTSALGVGTTVTIRLSGTA